MIIEEYTSWKMADPLRTRLINEMIQHIISNNAKNIILNSRGVMIEDKRNGTGFPEYLEW